MYLKNWIYNIYTYFYLFRKNKTSGNFYELIYRLYHFQNTNLALAASYTVFIVLIITRITILTSLNRRLIIRLRLMLEFFLIVP
jgi:hypothetical protein